MVQKRRISFVFAAALAIALAMACGIAYAASSDYSISYKPGTDDAVSNMPADDTGVGGSAKVVSDELPQRDGYEFLGWTLDYGVGVNYTVNYLEQDKGTVLQTADHVYGQPIGSTVGLDAPLIIGDYDLVGESHRDLTLSEDPDKNVVTFYYTRARAGYGAHCYDVTLGRYLGSMGTVSTYEVGSTVWVHTWQSWDGYRLISEDPQPITITRDKSKNVVTFYYEKIPEPPAPIAYCIIKCIDMYTGEELDTETVDGLVPGEPYKAYAPDLSEKGYDAHYPNDCTITLKEGENMIIFAYWTMQEDA